MLHMTVLILRSRQLLLMISILMRYLRVLTGSTLQVLLRLYLMLLLSLQSLLVRLQRLMALQFHVTLTSEEALVIREGSEGYVKPYAVC